MTRLPRTRLLAELIELWKHLMTLMTPARAVLYDGCATPAAVDEVCQLLISA